VKNQAVWITRQPFPRRMRGEILKLLGDSVEILERIEAAANLYCTESAMQNEKPRETNQDAKDLAEAIKTISRLANDGGIAVALFKGHGGKLAYDLFDAAWSTKGACLSIAAEKTIEDTKPVGGRPSGIDRASRLEFLGVIAEAGKQAHIHPSRSGVFPTLVNAIYEATGIDPDHSDRDIRDYLESLT